MRPKDAETRRRGDTEILRVPASPRPRVPVSRPPFTPSVFALAILLIPLGMPVFAQPRKVVVLFDGLTVDALRNPRLPALRDLADRGAIGLMNTAVAGPRTNTAAMLTLALGSLAPAEPTDEDAYQSDEPVERATAKVVYQRRTGRAVSDVSRMPTDRGPGLDGLRPSVGLRRHGNHAVHSVSAQADTRPATQRATLVAANRGDIRPPAHVVLHLGIAPLTRRGIAESLLGSVLARAGKSGSVAICGNADTDRPGRRVALLGLDRLGVAEHGLVSRACLAPAPDRPYGVRDNVDLLAQWAAAQTSDLVIVHLGDGARAESARQRLSVSDDKRAWAAAVGTLDAFLAALGRILPQDSTRILVLSQCPPAGASGRWDHLTLAVLAGPGIHHGVLTSATTRTRALIANIDAAPTLLYWLGVAPPAAMGGHPLQIVQSADPVGEAVFLDRRATVNDHALTPVFVFLGALTLICGFGGLAAHRLRATQTRGFAFGAFVLMNMPLAMMFAAPIPVGTVEGLGAVAIVIMVVCALTETAISRALEAERLLVLAAATTLAIAIDGLIGQPLIKFSLLSAYQIQGIRFHGIGNEYMGVLIGCTLLTAFLGRLRPWPAAALFAACALILSLPWFGDKAGGAIVSVVAFGTAWVVLRGRRTGWRTALLWTLVGFAAAFALAGLDRLLSGGGVSHMGGALGAAGERGWSYLWDVAERKAMMNLGIVGKPQTVAAIVAVAVFLVAVRRLLGDRVMELARAHSDWARGLPAAGWGAVTAFVFNDSGIVAALFLGGSFLMAGLYLLLDSRRSSESANAPQLHHSETA